MWHIFGNKQPIDEKVTGPKLNFISKQVALIIEKISFTVNSSTYWNILMKLNTAI